MGIRYETPEVLENFVAVSWRDAPLFVYEIPGHANIVLTLSRHFRYGAPMLSKIRTFIAKCGKSAIKADPV